jgi:hypothetical protein
MEAAKPGEIPTTILRYLSVYRNHCTLPEHVYFPRLEHLTTVGTECLFTAENVPALREFGTELDRRGRVLDVITSLPSLTALTVGPVRSEDFYQAISPLGLEHLGMSPTRNFRSMHGIERLPTLRTMRIVDFKRADSIEPLAHIPLLEEVFFQDCKGLPSLAPLAFCSSLQNLRFLGCGRLQWDGARDVLLARSVQIDDSFA